MNSPESSNQYWFARRFPVGHPRNAMAPVSRQGVRVVFTFLAWMVGGALLGGALTALGIWHWLFWVLGPVAFAACAAYGAWSFIRTARERGDHRNTVEDYKAGRVK